MEIKVVHEISQVYQLLQTRNPYNYIYQWDALAKKKWDNVICYGLFDDSVLKEFVMLFLSYDIPVLLAANFEHIQYTIELLTRIKKFLPAKFYTHMNHDTLQAVFHPNEVFHLEEYMNMGLCNTTPLTQQHYNEVVQLGAKDLGLIKELLSVSYPEAWLDDKLVALNNNFGIMADGKLISFAGIHAYSEEYQVVAIAHITTHPDYRKQGYGEKVIFMLIAELRSNIKSIGLNVKVNNFPAIHCYKKLGFKEFGKFVACEIQTRI